MNSRGLRWWSEGIRFECQGSARCCVSRGEYGYVYLTLEDRRRLAKHFGVSTREFTRRWCRKTDGLFHLDDRGRKECVFLEGTRSGVYDARPTQCRTWPFWPDLMGAKAWSREVAGFCPGVGKGPLHTEREIEEILAVQRRATLKMF